MGRLLFCALPFVVYLLPTVVSAAGPKTVEQVLESVHQYCGVCHKVPPPDVMPKKDWPKAIDAMVQLAANKYGAPFVSSEIVADIKAYYYGTAPEFLPRLPLVKNNHPSFTVVDKVLSHTSLPMVVNVNRVSLFNDQSAQILICDAERNEVSILMPEGAAWREKTLASIKVPARTRAIDIDQDGDQDILVGALGELAPSANLSGELWLLRQTEHQQFKAELLLNKLGRITDLNAADVDHDGDLDLVLAIFGGGDVGGVIWIENKQNAWQAHSIINVSGALNVDVADLNNDGFIDIVSLIAQEYEMVLALINDGKGGFTQEALAEAPHPMFGSTGMSLVDLDKDNDIDVLFTNGDAHDLQMDPKPYHGVQWLENRGQMQFNYRNIGRFYGAAVAKALDFDGDGDLDVLAGSWNNYWQEAGRQSLVWYENDGQQQYTPHGLLAGPTSIVTLDEMGLNDEGLPEVLAGALRMDLLLAQFANGKASDSDTTQNSYTRLMQISLAKAKNKSEVAK